MGGEAEILFGEGAGIFWGGACNEGHTTMLPEPEMEDFRPKKEKKKKKLIKEVRRLDYHDHVTDRPVHIGERMYLLLENTEYGI